LPIFKEYSGLESYSRPGVLFSEKLIPVFLEKKSIVVLGRPVSKGGENVL